MVAKKRGSKKSKSTSASAAATATDELFVPKGSAAAATHARTTSATASNGDDNNDTPNVELKVNEKFAKSFQEQKRKEELTKLERQRKLYGDAADEDESESESETEDEDGEQLTRDLDADIRKTLQLIRKKDPAIYDQSIAFFQKTDSDDDNDNDDDENDNDDDSDARAARLKQAKKQQKANKTAPLYYKDLVRQQVIAGDMDSDDERSNNKQQPIVTYRDEQAKLKQDFLQSLQQQHDSDNDDSGSDAGAKQNGNDDDDDDDALDGGLFTIRKKTADETTADATAYAQFLTSSKRDNNNAAPIDPDAFLEHYVSSEGWKDKRAAVPHYDDIVQNAGAASEDDDDSADELDRADAFEQQYNFRFEQDGASVIATHARRIDDSLRREDDARKRKRADRKARKALERQQKEEELRRLKNLKQSEIEHKLAKVARLMGKGDDATAATATGLTAADVDGAFDPDEYDKRMQQVFDDAYYNDGENEDEEAAMTKPVWTDDDDKELFAGLPVDLDDEIDEDETTAVELMGDDDDDEAYDDDGDDALSAAKAARMTPAELAKAKQQYLDELYALDYEDLIGDLQCRFKYRRVATNDFGLTAEEIMAADDKELQALVSLKRLAPYQDNEFLLDRKRVKQFKKTLADAKSERDAKRLRKQKDEEEEEERAGEQGDDAVEKVTTTAAVGGGKKRKRAKKNAAAITADEPTTAPVVAASDKKTDAMDATAVTDVATDDAAKKQQRRSKKKKSQSAATADGGALKATGLSSSRLESYKLTKSSKTKTKTK